MRYIFLLVLFVAALGTKAQESLTLSEAIQIGLSNHFGIQIERLNQEIARNNNTWGEAGRFPTVNFNVNQNNAITLPHFYKASFAPTI